MISLTPRPSYLCVENDENLEGNSNMIIFWQLYNFDTVLTVVYGWFESLWFVASSFYQSLDPLGNKLSHCHMEARRCQRLLQESCKSHACCDT